jgi:hypothetical protein
MRKYGAARSVITPKNFYATATPSLLGQCEVTLHDVLSGAATDVLMGRGTQGQLHANGCEGHGIAPARFSAAVLGGCRCRDWQGADHTNRPRAPQPLSLLNPRAGPGISRPASPWFARYRAKSRRGAGAGRRVPIRTFSVLYREPPLPASSDASPAARTSLAARDRRHHPAGMFVVSEAEAATIRTAFERGGELSAVVELRRLFPGITDNVQARECARTIAGWTPLPAPLRPDRRSRPRVD